VSSIEREEEMPLGERGGWERTESRYCGVETDFSNDVTHLLNFNISTGGFDYVLAPLVDPSYRPSLVEGNGVDTQVLPVCGSDLVLSPSQWSSHVVGMILFASPPCDFVLVMNMMGFDLSGKSSFSRKN
jgi:hypothetical protein